MAPDWEAEVRRCVRGFQARLLTRESWVFILRMSFLASTSHSCGDKVDSKFTLASILKCSAMEGYIYTS